jgi:multidrug transporter EmrE-like cation transporter
MENIQTGEQERMGISMTGLILVFIAAILMGSASLMLRGSIDNIGGFGEDTSRLLQNIFALLLQPMFIIGVIAYGAGTLMWMRVMSTEPLTIGYPILMGIAFVVITSGAAFFFKEAITLPKIIGMALVVAGVFAASNG